MFEALIDLVKLLGGSLKWALQLDSERRKRFAEQCDAIAVTLNAFLDESENRRKSRSLCEELRVNVAPIRELAKGTLSQAELDGLAFQLENLCDAWQAHTQATAPGGTSHLVDLEHVEVAAGHFRGLATRVRAM